MTLNTPETNLIAKNRNLLNYSGTIHEAFCGGVETFLLEDESFLCCKNPKVLLMDGVVISIKTSNMPKFETPWIMGKVNKRASARNDRQFKPLTNIERQNIERLIKGQNISFGYHKILRSSTNLGVQCLSYSITEKQKFFVLNESAKLFGTFLCKKVASIKSLVPAECTAIIHR